jgi:hypothetical protein
MVLPLSNSALKLSKKVYTLNAIRSAILSFQFGSCSIEDGDSHWIIDLRTMEEPIQESELLRRIDEFSLRESLNQSFAAERDAIIALAFGRE